MSEPGDRSVRGGGFKFTVSYGNDAIDGLTLDTGVSWESTGKLIEHSLFRFDPQKSPANQFAGFGFTGLHYVFAPNFAARLPYTCSAAE